MIYFIFCDGVGDPEFSIPYPTLHWLPEKSPLLKEADLVVSVKDIPYRLLYTQGIWHTLMGHYKSGQTLNQEELTWQAFLTHDCDLYELLGKRWETKPLKQKRIQHFCSQASLNFIMALSEKEMICSVSWFWPGTQGIWNLFLPPSITTTLWPWASCSLGMCLHFPFYSVYVMLL